MIGGVGISTTVYDLGGHCYLDSSIIDHGTEIENHKRERRVSRTATLDGGVAVHDTGYAAADRIIKIKVPAPTTAVEELFPYLVETYSEITVTTADGAFTGTPMSSWHDSDGALLLEIGVIEQIN